jgi:hypothetical protein
VVVVPSEILIKKVKIITSEAAEAVAVLVSLLEKVVRVLLPNQVVEMAMMEHLQQVVLVVLGVLVVAVEVGLEEVTLVHPQMVIVEQERVRRVVPEEVVVEVLMETP